MLGTPPPITRLMMIDELEGCRDLTGWPLPMLNCCQSMMAAELVSFTTVLLALRLVMVAEPAITCPPVGLARANTGVKAPRPRPRCTPRFRSDFMVALSSVVDSLACDMACTCI